MPIYCPMCGNYIPITDVMTNLNYDGAKTNCINPDCKSKGREIIVFIKNGD